MILSARFLYPSPRTDLAITLADGRVAYTDLALPPDVEVRRWLAAWLEAGGVIEAAPALVVALPVLTARQLRLGLLSLGVTLSQVDALIATLPEPERSVAQIEWQYSKTYDRQHPLVAQMAQALELSAAQLDAAWAHAAML